MIANVINIIIMIAIIIVLTDRFRKNHDHDLSLRSTR